MSEEFLHFLWKFKLIRPPFRLSSGEEMDILKSGLHNQDAGPDFFNALIRIDKTIWAGNVEIHVRSSDWIKHKHQNDPAYDNIILHVVYEHDRDIFRKNGSLIPCLELKNIFDKKLFDNYLDIIGSETRIPCGKIINRVDTLVFRSMQEISLVERLEKKSIFIENKLLQNNNDWEQSFFEHIAASFGLKVNAEAFELLAKSIPLTYLQRQKNELLQIEALLFGQAGFLQQDFRDSYPEQLKTEYLHLKNKFSLTPVPLHIWRFLRLRPVNFPGIRISQFAALIAKSFGLFSSVKEITSLHGIHELLLVKASPYWENHFRFDFESSAKKKTRSLGEDSRNSIIINSVIPFLFVYGKQKSETQYSDRAMDFLERMKAEENQFTRLWRSCNIHIESAFESQAMIELFKSYCRDKKCLECKIGIKLLQTKE